MYRKSKLPIPLDIPANRVLKVLKDCRLVETFEEHSGSVRSILKIEKLRHDSLGAPYYEQELVESKLDGPYSYQCTVIDRLLRLLCEVILNG